MNRLLLVALVFFFWPWWSSLPLVFICAWIGLTLLLRTVNLLWKKKRHEQEDDPKLETV